MSKLPELTDLEAKVFLGIMRMLRASSGGYIVRNDQHIATSSKLPAMFVAPLVDRLISKRIFEIDDLEKKNFSGLPGMFGALRGDQKMQVHPSMIELLFEYTHTTNPLLSDTFLISQENNDPVEELIEIPASDRFVRIGDNAPPLSEAAKEVKSTLSGLIEEIRSSNEFSVAEDDRLAVIRQVQNFRDMFDHASIRLRDVWLATRRNSQLAWLATEVGAGTIRAAAAKALDAVIAFIRLSL